MGKGAGAVRDPNKILAAVVVRVAREQLDVDEEDVNGFAGGHADCSLAAFVWLVGGVCGTLNDGLVGGYFCGVSANVDRALIS